MMKEEAMLIRKRLNKNELATLTASNGWLEKFKQTYGLRETSITGSIMDRASARTNFRLRVKKHLEHG